MSQPKPFLRMLAATAALFVLAPLLAGACSGNVEAAGSCDDIATAADELCAETGPGSECAIAPAEFLDACRAGCVLDVCLSRLCPDKGSEWCGESCADIDGAQFWKLFQEQAGECWGAGSVDEAFPACARSRLEKVCPELAGSDWASAIPILND